MTTATRQTEYIKLERRLVLLAWLNDLFGYKSNKELLSDIKANVNLIEYNPHPGCDFEASGKKRINKFAEILRQGGIETNIRYKRGIKINAACGQLGANMLPTLRAVTPAKADK